MLELKNIFLKYDDVPVLQDVSFSLGDGEIVAIVGESGAGKSSILKVLSGELLPTAGALFFDNKKLNFSNQLVRGISDITYVSQQFDGNDYFTVEELILNAMLHLLKQDRINFSNQLIQLLDLEQLRKHKAGTLSGGEKQRVLLACALAKEPRILLLDEPFSHLDVHLRRKVGRYLKTWVKKYKTTILLVTHEGEEALSWSDRILFLKQGRIFREYTPYAAYFRPKTYFEGAFFGELNSVRIDGKQFLFRPTAFYLKGNEKYKLKLTFVESEFRGSYFAHYFKLVSGKQVVLYGEESIAQLKEMYVVE